jgi:uncharacterized HhH-GPD family protein
VEDQAGPQRAARARQDLQTRSDDRRPTVPLSLPIEPEATKLLYANPLALLTGMLLDQQQAMEKAFSGPYVLTQRLGRDLDAHDIAAMDLASLEEVFAKPPVLHRFPRAFAKRMHDMCQMLVEQYDGDASKLWKEAKDGKDAVVRIGKLPGFGKQKSQIFVALLGKQFGVDLKGWREATGDYGTEGSLRSVADITDEGSLAKVREYKKAMKAAAKEG